MNTQLIHLKYIVRCPACSGGLIWHSGSARCDLCDLEFLVVDDVPVLIADQIPQRTEGPDHAGLLQFLPPRLHPIANSSRRFVRPSLVHRSRHTRSLTHAFTASFPSDATLLNVGAGASNYGENVINLDIVATPGIHVVGLAEHLPFRDAVFDGVLFQAVLEHVGDSGQALGEIRRVLRPAGAVFIEIPFMQGYHPAPHDHRRFTEQGLRVELEQHGFLVDRTGVAVGPASAMAWVTGEFLALLVSGRSGRIYRIARLATDWLAWPIKWADSWLDTHEMAHVIASGVWASARKPADQDSSFDGPRGSHHTP